MKIYYLQIEDELIPVFSFLTKRKGSIIRFRMRNDGLHISLPKNFNKKLLDIYLKSKYDAILKRWIKRKPENKQVKGSEIVSITVLGDVYDTILIYCNPLEIYEPIKLDDDIVLCYIPEDLEDEMIDEYIHATFHKRYVELGNEKISKIFHELIKFDDFDNTTQLETKTYYSRRGRWKKDKTLSINNMIVCYDLEAIRYIILYLLCMNKYDKKSPEFRDLLLKMEPDAENYKLFLGGDKEYQIEFNENYFSSFGYSNASII